MSFGKWFAGKGATDKEKAADSVEKDMAKEALMD